MRDAVKDKGVGGLAKANTLIEPLRIFLGFKVYLFGGLMPFARESADHDKILIYERAA